MPGRRWAVIIPIMHPLLPKFRGVPGALAWPALALALSLTVPRAAELQPRAYPWLLSHATLVVAGTVEGVSGGLFGDGRKATIRVEGLVKGRWNRQEMEVAWNDKEFEETAYKRDARVVVFAVMKKDSTFAQAAPGVSCWPVERVDFKGKNARAAEYAYPLDLLTQVPASALRYTESVEKSMNFRVAKRTQWIVLDNLLPPLRPLVLPKPAPPRKAAPKKGPPGAGKPAKPKKSASPK